MAVTKRTRYEVLRRDGHRCRYCGATVEDGVKLTVDHVIPVALGGHDTPDNLVAACTDCNAGKSSTSPDAEAVDQVTDDAIRWAEAMQTAAEMNARRRELTEIEVDYFGSVWDGWTYNAPDGTRAKIPRSGDWELSVSKFFDAGLTTEDLESLVPVAMNSQANVDQKWKYFCGCAWRTLDDRQQEARRLIERGDI